MKNLSLKKLFQGKIFKLGIKKIIPASGFKKELPKINVRIISRMPSSNSINDVPTIAIITKTFLNRLFMMPESLCRQEIEKKIIKKNIVFLILANSSSIPAVFENLTVSTNISVASSKFDEHYLRSLLKALIREKFQKTICVHGVVIEAEGKGILITGASGIGKTTAALNFVAKNGYWVADDFIIIKKNKHGKLIARGHKKIQNYIHKKDTGIIPAEKLLGPNRIKSTKLYTIVEVERKTGLKSAEIIKNEKKKILDIKLICFHINIPSTDYFDEILLKKALEQLPKENR